MGRFNIKLNSHKNKIRYMIRQEKTKYSDINILSFTDSYRNNFSKMQNSNFSIIKRLSFKRRAYLRSFGYENLTDYFILFKKNKSLLFFKKNKSLLFFKKNKSLLFFNKYSFLRKVKNRKIIKSKKNFRFFKIKKLTRFRKYR